MEQALGGGERAACGELRVLVVPQPIALLQAVQRRRHPLVQLVQRGAVRAGSLLHVAEQRERAHQTNLVVVLLGDAHRLVQRL